MIDWILNQLFGPPKKADGSGKRNFTHWIDEKGNTYAFDSTRLDSDEPQPINTDTASYWVDADGKVQCSINGVPGWVDKTGKVRSAFDTDEAPSELDPKAESGFKQLTDAEQIARGFVPSGWLKTPLKMGSDGQPEEANGKSVQNVSVTISATIDDCTTTTTICGITFEQLPDAIQAIRQFNEVKTKCPCGQCVPEKTTSNG